MERDSKQYDVLVKEIGSASTKTNIKFFVDPEEQERDDVSYKCSCCEADGMQWKRTR